MSDEQQQPRRLPLWKDWLERNEVNFCFGQFFSNEVLESALSCRRDSLEFAFALVKIRKALRRKGMNITARGQCGIGYSIGAPETNTREMHRLQTQAVRAMREGVVLGTNTPLDSLNADDRRRHEAMLEKMATRLALVSRRSLPQLKKIETQCMITERTTAA